MRLPRKCEKNAGIRAIFHILTERWTPENKRFLELTRINCPRKHGKTPANTARHDVFQTFTERWTLENKRFLRFTHIHCPGKCEKSTRKLPQTLEYTIISVRLPNGEHWKTCVFLNSLEFTIPENTRKREKTPVNAGILYAFRKLTERWILENNVFY